VVLPAFLCAGKNAELAKNSMRCSKVHHQMEKKLKVLELQEAMILSF
jgi:hypothetical protein